MQFSERTGPGHECQHKPPVNQQRIDHPAAHGRRQHLLGQGDRRSNSQMQRVLSRARLRHAAVKSMLGSSKRVRQRHGEATGAAQCRRENSSSA
uniref:DUF1534 domain-containing protein n=1 Tax=Macrostomum lignano TaxID=282301 RepID=A0A1I8FQW7_9PLAT